MLTLNPVFPTSEATSARHIVFQITMTLCAKERLFTGFFTTDPELLIIFPDLAPLYFIGSVIMADHYGMGGGEDSVGVEKLQSEHLGG